MTNKPGKKTIKSPARPAYMHPAFVYLILMLGGFPLFFRDNYIDMMESKWLFFMVSTLAGALVTGVLYVLWRFKGSNGQAAYTIAPKGLLLHEKFLLGYLAVLMISWLGTIPGGYFKDAWTGSGGKMAGVFFYLILILSYFLVSRFGYFNEVSLQVCLWANFFVFSLAVLNHFSNDPLHMYENLEQSQHWMFSSTMGNINAFSGFLAIFIPFTFALFIYEKSTDRSLLFGLMVIVCSMGVISVNGDAGILGCLFGFAVLLWFSMESLRLLSRYFAAMSLFFISAGIIGAMDKSFLDTVKDPLETLPVLIARSPLTVICIAGCVTLSVLCFSLDKKRRDLPLKAIRRTVFIAVAALICLMLLVFGWFSLIDRSTDLGRWHTYLRFSDLWGSSRGFTYKRTMILYFEKYTLFQKLFGFGPDLMLVPYHTYFDQEIFAKMGAYLADAHSEILQTLGTTGLLGALSWIAFQITLLVSLIKGAKKSPLIIGIAAGLSGYMIQGLMVSPQTVSTPAFFLMAAVAMQLISSNC